MIARILQQRLFASPLGGLAWMLAMVLARDAIMAIPSYRSHSYTVAWEWTLPPLLAVQVWAGLDTLRAVARLYPKFGNFAVRLYLVCMAISVAACCVSLPFELGRLSGEETFLRALFLLQRWVDSWIAGTLMLVSVFLARFPAPSKKPPRNLVLHTVLLTIYFAGYAVLFLTENLTTLGGAAIAERAQLALTLLVFAAWATGLSKEGAGSESWPQIDVILLRTVDATKK